MNVLIGKIIKDLLSGLPYFDKAAGLVQTISRNDISDTKPSLKRFPVEVDVSEESNLNALYPHEDFKGMFYLEDGGVKSEGNNDWTSDLTLVCWFNPKKIASNPEAVSANAVAEISNMFKSFYNNSSISRLKVNIVSLPIRDVNIFAKYTYDETQTQFIMPPYDFFSMKLKCSFRLNPTCLEPLIPSQPC
ncbi:hypothetical protein [Sphingobacterium sp.]|uniref:hypothetical protein n=1 Tax=Sphingobacterium sp. TaxID=341027 RepID=UPI0028ACB318|nr:hypothetical protein [Sphingobacterium sp.]